MRVPVLGMPRRWPRASLLLLLPGLLPIGVRVEAQVLTLDQARARAVEVSPVLAAAREAVRAAGGRERQAGALPNPVLSYSREQTSRDGGTSWQNIALVEQALDLGGARGARRAAARLRHEAAEADARAAEAAVRFEVTSAYAHAVAADRRAARASEAADAFRRARRTSAERRAGGDVSGYADRRIALEAARYAALAAEAELERHSARLTLGTLLSAGGDSVVALGVALEEAPALPPVTLSLDSLRGRALAMRAELTAATLAARASDAEARAASRGAWPAPTAGLGFKNERAPGDPTTATGFVLQLSLPLPLWDRQRGAVTAWSAEGRERSARAALLRRDILAEVARAWVAHAATETQVNALRPALGAEARAAVRAAETAYLEGEIPLVEWLDTVRAYQEAEASFASLVATQLIRRAALERAVGTPLE
ncbi:MAG: TolC family protein [Gemmatimonadetes bacterium]|nr:TolC family protein [Gemmatimonadota bacterium]MBK6780927.1 TolC family protein [Gemmatimonadota bacterium]MBP9199403.1 TolC family protein [Gemmatimonadales bacterium]